MSCSSTPAISLHVFVVVLVLLDCEAVLEDFGCLWLCRCCDHGLDSFLCPMTLSSSMVVVLLHRSACESRTAMYVPSVSLFNIPRHVCSPNVCRFLDCMRIAKILLNRTLPLDGCDLSRGRIDRNLDADPVNLVATWGHTSCEDCWIAQGLQRL